MPVNFIFGSYFNSKLIYLAGEPGAAVVVGSYNTSSQYNNHDVVGYHVLINTIEGKTIQTSFEDDDFNVYPSHNSVTYPQQGGHFNVRYLKHFPVALSLWPMTTARGPCHCNVPKNKLDEARSKFEFNRSDLTFKAAYINSINNYINKRCYIDNLDLQKYYGDIKAAEYAKP